MQAINQTRTRKIVKGVVIAVAVVLSLLGILFIMLMAWLAQISI